MDSMFHFAAKVSAPHNFSNMLKVHAGPGNPPVKQSLFKSLKKIKEKSKKKLLGRGLPDVT